jgi:hypothetical protein
LATVPAVLPFVLGQAGGDQRAVGLRHAHGRDRDRWVRTAHARDGAGCIVGHDHADRARVLRVLDLDREAAGAAADQGDLAANRLGIGGVERVQAEPGLSACRATWAIWPVSGDLSSFGPKSASPIAYRSPAGELAPAPTTRSCGVAVSTDGTAAVTRGPVQDRPDGLSADAARSALVMSTHSLLVVLSSR